jgi:hypothetical protein
VTLRTLRARGERPSDGCELPCEKKQLKFKFKFKFMARALLVADPLLAAITDNDAPEARPGQTSDDTLTASEPHRVRGHEFDLFRPHAEKTMLKQETETETMPAQLRSDASHATEQTQEQAHAPTRASAEPIAASSYVAAENPLHRNLLIDMGYIKLVIAT